MNMRLGTTAAVWLIAAAAAFADPQATRGKLESVTVYRGQALVTRAVEVAPGGEDAATGLVEVVVTDLPSRVILESLHAEAGAGIQVRSVRSRTRAVGEENRDDVRKLDQRIEGVNEGLVRNARYTAMVAEQQAYIKSLEAFVAPTSTAEMTHGVLNAETLERVTSYVMKTRELLAARELELGAELKRLNSEMEVAQRERQLLTSGSSRTVNEAVVFVSRDEAARGAGTLRLRYLVADATWTPSYNVRRDGRAAEGITLEYYASIQQMSGEDWGNVAMTLSTATPSLVSRAPSLASWKIGLGGPEGGQQQAASKEEYAQKRDTLTKMQKDVERQWMNRAIQPGGGAGSGDDTANILSLNTMACDIQVLDLVAGERVRREAAAQRMPVDENLSVTYQIGGRTSLPSRQDRQLVQIASLPMAAEFAKIGVPVLTGQVYDEATATNAGQMVLLAGPVTAYRDGAFVGTGDLPTTAAGQSFTVGFGSDSSLRTSRTLVERTEQTQGGNKIVELTYRLTIENFGGEAAQVRVLDRLPKAEAADVRVELLSSSPEVSAAPEYLQGDKKDGILRWDVAVPAQAIGAKASSVEFRFRLEYDKQRMLATAEGPGR